MEAGLEVYTWPDRDDIRIVCRDEISTQLLDDIHEPVPAQPAQRARRDYEYERCGTANIFLGFAPLRGQRWTTATAQRTRVDWAVWAKDLVDVRYPDAALIVVVMDTLNVHGMASLYEAFAPAEAKRIAMKLEIHYTPKHGRWRNMAEIEASVLRRQCLDGQRIPDRATLTHELQAGEARRNAHGAAITWSFSLANARVKLRRLYPSMEP